MKEIVFSGHVVPGMSLMVLRTSSATAYYLLAPFANRGRRGPVYALQATPWHGASRYLIEKKQLDQSVFVDSMLVSDCLMQVIGLTVEDHPRLGLLARQP